MGFSIVRRCLFLILGILGDCSTEQTARKLLLKRGFRSIPVDVSIYSNICRYITRVHFLE